MIYDIWIGCSFNRLPIVGSFMSILKKVTLEENKHTQRVAVDVTYIGLDTHNNLAYTCKYFLIHHY